MTDECDESLPGGQHSRDFVKLYQRHGLTAATWLYFLQIHPAIFAPRFPHDGPFLCGLTSGSEQNLGVAESLGQDRESMRH